MSNFRGNEKSAKIDPSSLISVKALWCLVHAERSMKTFSRARAVGIRKHKPCRGEP